MVCMPRQGRLSRSHDGAQTQAQKHQTALKRLARPRRQTSNVLQTALITPVPVLTDDGVKGCAVLKAEGADETQIVALPTVATQIC